MKISLNKPKNIKAFLDGLQTIKNEKKKAPNLLFEEIEHDIQDKEKFVVEQNDKIKDMNDSYLTLQDYKQVLTCVQRNVSQLMSGAKVRGSFAGGAHLVDEEEKTAGAPREDRIPLIP